MYVRMCVQWSQTKPYRGAFVIQSQTSQPASQSVGRTVDRQPDSDKTETDRHRQIARQTDR